MKKIKKFFVDILLKLMENRKIRTWVLCFALRHASAAKIVEKLGIDE
jgi:hypothetical protein